MKFYEESHRYIHNKIDFTSVTRLYSMYKKKKDWFAIAEKYAVKNGETPEYWLKVWEKNRDDSANFGSAYHLKREGIKKAPLVKSAIDLNNLEGHYKELIIWSYYYRVAGQADDVMIKDGSVKIRDFKTCKKIDTEAKSFYKKGLGRTTERYLPPISHMSVFNLNDFTLQLSLLAIMLEDYGYSIDRLIVEHITFEERDKGYDHLLTTLKEGSLKEVSIDYEIPYLRKEARAILEHQRNTLWG